MAKETTDSELRKIWWILQYYKSTLAFQIEFIIFTGNIQGTV